MISKTVVPLVPAITAILWLSSLWWSTPVIQVQVSHSVTSYRTYIGICTLNWKMSSHSSTAKIFREDPSTYIIPWTNYPVFKNSTCLFFKNVHVEYNTGSYTKLLYVLPP
ncbi:hypothetical protein BDV41DRAFT_517078 [Aspergillus transmontanensis]|uniref:Uncharacterized protein n=1 Tax=Aspergillus transmontanensis TaxID=1034304 RepID=A0A5N6WH87_9EURO|nr:hypothetical protein BDV41DRAFT_517078 [Aspergillus transmontanensis]